MQKCEAGKRCSREPSLAKQVLGSPTNHICYCEDARMEESRTILTIRRRDTLPTVVTRSDIGRRHILYAREVGCSQSLHRRSSLSSVSSCLSEFTYRY